MKLPYTKKEILDTITIDGENVIEQGNLLSLFWLIETQTMTRAMAWQIVRMIHLEELNCPLTIYGTLNTFALCKDKDEFKRLYRQGLELLQEKKIIDESDDVIMDASNDIVEEISKAIKGQKFKIVKINMPKKDKKDKKGKKPTKFIFPDTDRFRNLN